MQQMRCSVCIATFRRPDGLRRLLDSLAGQVLPPDLQLQIVVVDNDGDDPAAPRICEEFRNDHPDLEVIVGVEPVQNIALTRNRGVALATGDVLAFIDDDETADPHWIARLIEIRERYEAECVFGRVTASFPPGTPTWVAELDLFNRPSPPTGSDARYTQTSNCLVRADAMAAHDRDGEGPFDPAFGRTGGEDTDLFERMRAEGASLVAAYEAEVTELVPAERTTVSFLLRRAFRQGSLYTYRSTRGQGFVKNARQAVSSIGRVVVGVGATLLSFTNPSRRAHWAVRTAAYCGHLAGVVGAVPRGY